MQTAEEARDLLPVSLDAGDEGQRGPEESVELLREAQENHTGVSVQVLDCGGERQVLLGTSCEYKYFITAIQKSFFPLILLLLLLPVLVHKHLLF